MASESRRRRKEALKRPAELGTRELQQLLERDSQFLPLATHQCWNHRLRALCYGNTTVPDTALSTVPA